MEIYSYSLEKRLISRLPGSIMFEIAVTTFAHIGMIGFFLYLVWEFFGEK